MPPKALGDCLGSLPIVGNQTVGNGGRVRWQITAYRFQAPDQHAIAVHGRNTFAQADCVIPAEPIDPVEDGNPFQPIPVGAAPVSVAWCLAGNLRLIGSRGRRQLLDWPGRCDRSRSECRL